MLSNPTCALEEASNYPGEVDFHFVIGVANAVPFHSVLLLTHSRMDIGLYWVAYMGMVFVCSKAVS